jgi:hypothetical protein
MVFHKRYAKSCTKKRKKNRKATQKLLRPSVINKKNCETLISDSLKRIINNKQTREGRKKEKKQIIPHFKFKLQMAWKHTFRAAASKFFFFLLPYCICSQNNKQQAYFFALKAQCG